MSDRERSVDFGYLRWGCRGAGIDIEPSMRMWGLCIGTVFLGVMHKDNPTASSSPTVKPPRYVARPTHPVTEQAEDGDVE